MDTLHERERMTWAQWGMMWTPCIKRQNIVGHLVGNDVDTFPMQRTLSASAKKHDSCPIHFATLGPRALDTFDLSVKSISKSFQNLISIFISYQYLKNCSLSHLPIFPHFEKLTHMPPPDWMHEHGGIGWPSGDFLTFGWQVSGRGQTGHALGAWASRFYKHPFSGPAY